MIKLDTLEKQAKFIFLGIGSNLGNRKKNIDRAKIELSNNNIRIIRYSSYYETLSWPNINHPKFLNIVLKVSTNLEPIELLRICKKLKN